MAESENESLRAACPDCKCTVFMPLMGIWIDKSFQGNRLRMIWPDRAQENKEEFAGPRFFIRAAIEKHPACDFFVFYLFIEGENIFGGGLREELIPSLHFPHRPGQCAWRF